MKRSLAAALVAAMFFVGIPAAFATDVTPVEPTTTSTTTTTTTTTTATTTTTTTATTPTTTTIAPTDEEPIVVEDPPAEQAPVEEAPLEEDPVEDTDADAEPPADEPRVPKYQVRRVDVTRDIVFPVAGINYYYAGFGDCRDDCEREHHGIDIMTYGWKGVPVVAAHSGTIRKVRDDREWCIVEVKSPDRWFTRYVHLNNDTPGYDDEDYECLLPGVEVGAHVEAGQIIGWIGDSGNAEWTPPHLHFEIRMPNGLPVDPYKSLKAAERIQFSRVGVDGDPVATAAQIAGYAYSNGSGVVNVMATTDHQVLLGGGFSALELSGPLLLSEPGYLPEATIEMFGQLNPSRVVVVGDGLEQAVIDQLELRFPIVGRTPMPPVTGESYVEPDTGTIVEIPEPEPSPLSLVVVGDRSELPEDTSDDLDRMTWTMQTTVFEGTDSGRWIGRDTYQGPGRSGSRNVLYFQTGDTYTRIRAREAPETPPEYGVIVLEAGRVSEATLTFLTSLADLPVMPLWR
jgi:murein DD-endopeptidase MepM/ murein hydrolase activator NlpD